MKIESDISYGIVPLQKRDGVWKILLVHHIAGHWSFPKGHREEGESEVETASRELEEETGLHVDKLLDFPPLEEAYVFHHAGKRIKKKVRYFIALVSGKEYPQLDELFGCDWFTFEKAREKLTFSNTRDLLDEVEKQMGDINDDTSS